MLQYITCPCGKKFAACAEPYCYEDEDWQKNMRNYVKKGCIVKMSEKQTWHFENCTCPNMKPVKVDKNQILIFDGVE